VIVGKDREIKEKMNFIEEQSIQMNECLRKIKLVEGALSDKEIFLEKSRSEASEVKRARDQLGERYIIYFFEWPIKNVC
jgi:hypothetical protein